MCAQLTNRGVVLVKWARVPASVRHDTAPFVMGWSRLAAMPDLYVFVDDVFVGAVGLRASATFAAALAAARPLCKEHRSP